MLLAITTTHSPATDLGYLLGKNPARFQSFELTFGQVHVFYPEANAERCTAALLLDVDPVGLVRGRGPAGDRHALDQYVNDRPYVASSFLSVAISNVFGSALGGRCKDRPDLVTTPIPLRATIASIPCGAGETLLRKLFEPLGWHLEARGVALDEKFPEWGASRYHTVTLVGTATLQQLLSHIYVLVPVLDGDKHYWVGDDEVEKLLRHGGDWLPTHPERELIATRYLKYRRSLIDDALDRLAGEDAPEPVEDRDAEEAAVERPISLNEQRLGAVAAALRSSNARRILDLGCGEGRLIRALLEDRSFEKIVGADVSHRSLEISRERLFERGRHVPLARDRVELLHSSLTYRDRRLEGFDAAAVVEVIEHLDPHRLNAFERALFEFARPGTVVLTTPNADYNIRWPALPAGKYRHRDHRFEWTRAEFTAWCKQIHTRFGYTFRILPIGPDDPEVGAPTQMAVFSKEGEQ
jgi:3' terminal RNA ribose 2'-O-methyltransferase Hen1